MSVMGDSPDVRGAPPGGLHARFGRQIQPGLRRKVARSGGCDRGGLAINAADMVVGRRAVPLKSCISRLWKGATMVGPSLFVLRLLGGVTAALAVITVMSSAACAGPDIPRSVPTVAMDYALPGDLRWIVLASRRDGEAAIGIARQYQPQLPKVQVVQARNGRYAIIVGPEQVQSEEQFKRQFKEGRYGLPDDFYLSRGNEFVARAWQNANAVVARATLSRSGVTVSAGDLVAGLTVAPSGNKDNKDEHLVTMEGRENGNVVFTARSEPLFSDQPHAQVTLVQLEGRTPQAVFSYYAMGAHCCMMSQLATKDSSGRWSIVDAGGLDGDSGPAFEDLDGDGQREMLSGDNGFLYRFYAYSGSWMPAKIEKLVDGMIVDVTGRPEYQRYHRQYLAWMEDSADEETWKTNGFLAGWVAQKILVGEGADAWARLPKLYDRQMNWGTQECTIKVSFGQCPENRKRDLPFPVALRRFLDEKGYR
jgi:hypothetical protein